MSEFCSISSSARNESLSATAPYVKNFLLIEYPRPWANNAVIDALIPEQVKNYLFGQIKNNVYQKILLIKKDNKPVSNFKIFAINNTENSASVNKVIVEEYKDILDLNFNDLFNSSNSNESIYLVCTNGKKDKCCSKFGIPTYQKLSTLSENVWQCTHVGGDRFASNVIHLPYSHVYGHCNVDKVSALLKFSSENKIFGECYRGKSCYRKVEQAAEIFLRKFLNYYSFEGMTLIEDFENEHIINKVRFRVEEDVFDVSVEIKKSENNYYLTCNAQALSSYSEFNLINIQKV
jgi:hypothetical protein